MAIQVMRVEERWILKDYRDKLGMTQQQVADKARIQLRQYQRYESGERNLSSSSFNVACRVIEALGLDPTRYHHGDYVFGDGVAFSWEGLHRASDGVSRPDIKVRGDE
ncbi:MAG: helix-turn-helix domain-containing protein [Oscillospiraceae bacterium]|jgi:transcriptional regulator with XRE-family HTH domain